MTDLTENTSREFAAEYRKARFGVGADLKVIVGQAMIASAAGMVNATPTAGGKFLGFAVEPVDNRVAAADFGGPGGAAFDGFGEVAVEGYVWLTVDENGETWDQATHVGDTVYASDGDTFTLAAGTNNITIGKIVALGEGVEGTTVPGLVLVKFENAGARSL